MVIARASGTFCDAHSVEFEAKPFFDFKVVPRWGGRIFSGTCACLNPDVLSVPETLVKSIRILVAPTVLLAHQWHKS